MDHKLLISKVQLSYRRKKPVSFLSVFIALNLYAPFSRKSSDNILNLVDKEPEELWNEFKEVVRDEGEKRLAKNEDSEKSQLNVRTKLWKLPRRRNQSQER